MRTSLTHPLQIGSVQAQPRYGRIGITLCPGKKQPSAMSGAWDRDLGADLEVIRAWGAAALISLIEPAEMDQLAVTELGPEVAARHMEWIHLPIRDVSVPGAAFERAWAVHAPGIRARIKDGFNVLVHCKGGLGRAGTVAARLLAELGSAPADAIARVRSVRPGAIETPAQEAYVRSFSTVEEDCPSAEPAAVQDRGLGAFVGLAVGDAVGTTLEFTVRDSCGLHTDMIGGGPFGLAAGQWTDDTAMALALADSLARSDSFDPADLMTRFVDWRDEGTYSCTRRCFDIGITVSQALRRWQQTGDPVAGSTDPQTAGNGSLMRLAPVALRYWSERTQLRRIAAEQSRTTHGAPEAVSACVAFAETLADAIAGEQRWDVLRTRRGAFAGAIGAIMAGSWRGKRRDDIQSSGYVVHSLEAALWSVGRTADFRSAVLTAANLGGDADTTAAITGQLAGALYGLSGIPSEWLSRLAWRARLEAAGAQLLHVPAERVRRNTTGS